MRKGFKIVKIILSILVLAIIVVFVIAAVINRNDLTMENIMSTITSVWKKDKFADEFFYDGESAEPLGGGIAVVSHNGVQVLGADGEETLISSFIMDSPALDSNGVQAVAYDIGGNILKTFNKNTVLTVLEPEHEILSAGININGMLTVSTRESMYTTSVTVYDENGNAVYKWYSGSGYILDAEVSEDNKNLAVLVISDSGSDIVYFKLDSEEEQSRYQMPGKIMLDIEYLKNGNLAAISGDEIVFLDGSGQMYSSYDFAGKPLDAYDLSFGDKVAVAYRNGGVGYDGKAVFIDYHGEVLSTVITEETVKDISVGKKISAVLFEESVLLCQPKAEDNISMSVDSGYTDIFMREDGSVLAAGEYQARAYRQK